MEARQISIYTPILVFFIYGLAYFSLGLAVAFEARRPSGLALSRHLPWLAAFGLTHSLVEWIDMFLLIWPPLDNYAPLVTARELLLPISAVLLVRFGIGLIGEAGPLPEWLTLVPAVLVIPAALVVGYGLVIAITEPPLRLAADVWSRYLLYFPGCLLAAIGFMRQSRRLPQAGLGHARPLLLGAALAFGLNAIAGGLIVPAAPYGLAPWLNIETAARLTGMPAQVWRALAALTVTVLVIRALGIFEAERKHDLARLSAEREQAHRATLLLQLEARRSAEEWTNALTDISRSVANLESIDAVLAIIVGAARRLLDSDVAALGLWDESGQVLVLKCFATAELTEQAISRPIVDPAFIAAIRQGRPCRVPEELLGLPGRWKCPALEREIQTAGLVPLRLNGQVVGGLWMAREQGAGYATADLVRLERLADQAVIALEHALMAARLQSLAVLEERARIAREMHDGVAQVLGYLSLETHTLEALVKSGDSAATLDELKVARAHIVEAQADVREGILSLRTTLSGQAGLLSALQQYVDEFEIQTGIRTSMLMEAGTTPRLSPLAEAQLVRIVQEAMTNVRKHAHAPSLKLRLALRDKHLHVSIADDGVGFAVQDARRGHFGLPTMRERAESVGGGLTIKSKPGDGTRVEVWLPQMPA